MSDAQSVLDSIEAVPWKGESVYPGFWLELWDSLRHALETVTVRRWTAQEDLPVDDLRFRSDGHGVGQVRITRRGDMAEVGIAFAFGTTGPFWDHVVGRTVPLSCGLHDDCLEHPTLGVECYRASTAR